jgi:iron complex transport system ATP-binding protein
MSALTLEAARVTLTGGVRALDGTDLRVAAGETVGLLGPNGAGKTTALRALLGLQRLDGGRASLDGADPRALSPRARARRVAYLPQTRTLAWPIGVRETVALGRFAHCGPMGRLDAADAAAVASALTACDLDALADRSTASLSGGELARVHVARALAAEAPALIADEPVAALDPGHAEALMGLLTARAKAGGAVLVVLHDLSLAARHCDRVIVLDHGRVVAEGAPADALTPALVARVHGVAARWSEGDLVVTGAAFRR